MSFYKLPAPWNPGYVIPRYVQAEPPERGTITTQWLPRGTIPQLIPDYLAVPKNQIKQGSSLAKHSLSGTCFDEGTLAGHSLAGDSLGATAYQLEPLGASSFSAHGQKVARDLMNRMKRLPPDQRATVMKKTLGAIDRTLPARAEKYAREAQQKMKLPAPKALEHGIAKAVTEGTLTELATLGRRARPQALSGARRGRGRRHLALGALPIVKIGQAATAPVTTSNTATASGMCSADGQFVWIAATATVPGHWQRLAAGETCAAFTPDGAAPDVRVHTGTQPVVAPTTPASYRAVEVGPFQFPADQSWSRATWWGTKLPLDWQAFIRRVAAGSSGLDAAMSTFFSAASHFSQSYIGTGVTSSPSWNPVARTVHPDSGKDYGVFLSLTFRYPDKPMNDPVANPPILNVIWAPIQKSWYENIWDWIEKIAAKIVDVVGDALNAVKDATCSLLQQPGVSQAAVSSAAAAPSPYTAGAAAGVVVGQNLCGGEQQPQMPSSSFGSGGWILPVAIGGGALLALYALTR